MINYSNLIKTDLFVYKKLRFSIGLRYGHFVYILSEFQFLKEASAVRNSKHPAVILLSIRIKISPRSNLFYIKCYLLCCYEFILHLSHISGWIHDEQE